MSVVPGASPLAFVSRDLHIRTFLYQVEGSVVPDWFGVAIPDGITDFSRPILYFHPSTAGAGYEDGVNNATYFGKNKSAAIRTAKETKWLDLFAYVDRLGGQLAGAIQFGGSPNQVVILPFMPSSALSTTGILPDHWSPIISDILADVRATVTGVSQPLTITDLVIAGYSFGTSVASVFRTRANASSPLAPTLRQFWDFDGSPVSVSNSIVNIAGQLDAVKYSEGARAGSLALPSSRWSAYPTTPPDEDPALPQRNDIHHLIRDFMFMHAALQR